jgi:long-chain fatty acid transport protein
MKKIFAALGTAVLMGAFAAAPAGATNGMDMIGYSTRSTGMGGADVAVDGDASSVSGNPAVVSAATPSSATVQFTALMPVLGYQDPANDVDGENNLFPLPLLGYVHKFGASPWSAGLGLYAQGGMGAEFQNVRTPAGTSDEIMSEVSFLRINPLVAYEVNPKLKLGATLLLGYAMAEFKLFPDTPGMNSGLNVQDLASFGYAAKIGAQYKINEKVRIGATYLSESKVELDGGTATLNFGPQGGLVKYDAELQDFTWPQQFEFGVAYLPAKGLLIAADVKWINWSATVDQPKLKVSNPPAGYPATPFPDENGNPMSSDTATFDMAWDDQFVYALGAEYAFNEKHTFRAGVNYGKSPVPDEKLNPLFPAITELHATIGYGFTTGRWGFDFAYEHAFEKTQSNPDANGPAPGAPVVTVSHSQNTLSAALTYRY